MELSIEHRGKKRKILGPFALCGKDGDLEILRDALIEHLEKKGVYGWVKINVSGGLNPDGFEITLEQPSIPNTPPEEWEK